MVRDRTNKFYMTITREEAEKFLDFCRIVDRVVDKSNTDEDIEELLNNLHFVASEAFNAVNGDLSRNAVMSNLELLKLRAAMYTDEVAMKCTDDLIDRFK